MVVVDESNGDESKSEDKEKLLNLPEIEGSGEEKQNELGDIDIKTENVEASRKRIMTGFQLFVVEEKPKLLQESVCLNEAQISQELASKWKEMDSKQRQQYITKAQATVDDLLSNTQ
mmetsp:Transcript_42877/g.68801  ORF Transcript_42877/g.68801 Transcript_42877/m.68801 type:complete len:117 (+) Transcript_42877:2-352(+)|eukprot:CAMPEP_0197046622 /NCGR_PEP_ID=MMETSP1384-20130603/22320_1 /TAXON_ID=29189 /ORGANISM="Ammonia sp." /LENGTH=116 /DNA_ID=CAMNT_0042478453 /DNA_START=408 /DNA_END=758 /DNA_ORIENTATION=-